MKKINRNGFALAETLIVSVIAVTILGVIFTHFYPLIGEYNKRETYDDVDGKYAAYWLKVILEDNITLNETKNIAFKNNINTNKYEIFDCNEDFLDNNAKSLCTNLKSSFNITDMYITKYNISDTKTKLININPSDRSFKEYIEYLPDYKKLSQTGAEYRIIIKMTRTKDENNYKAYATMEVNI